MSAHARLGLSVWPLKVRVITFPRLSSKDQLGLPLCPLTRWLISCLHISGSLKRFLYARAVDHTGSTLDRTLELQHIPPAGKCLKACKMQPCTCQAEKTVNVWQRNSWTRAGRSHVSRIWWMRKRIQRLDQRRKDGPGEGLRRGTPWRQ